MGDPLRHWSTAIFLQEPRLFNSLNKTAAGRLDWLGAHAHFWGYSSWLCSWGAK